MLRRLMVAALGPVLSIAVLVDPAPGRSASSKPGSPCRPAGAKTRTETRAVRVVARGGWVYACWKRSGKTVRLGRVATDSVHRHVNLLQARGTFVAYTTTTDYGAIQPYSRARLTLLAGGVRRSIGPVGCAPTDPRQGHAVWALALTRGGQLAWSCALAPGTLDVAEIRAYDDLGPRLLADGPGISPSSLALSDDSVRPVVYWLRSTPTGQRADFAELRVIIDAQYE
jgi:hypothetical protein